MVQKKYDLIKLASPDIRESDIEKAVAVLKSGNLVEGNYVSQFEKDFSEFTEIDHVTVSSSATAGLHLILKALDIKVGDWVIVPAFTFPATANAVENVGANVIFSDVGPTTYVSEPNTLKQTIESNLDKNLKAIIVVHEFGYPAKIKEIAQLAKTYNLKLIEDSACALGTIADGKHVGYFSDGAVFSFHPRKAITSGEGGAIISRDKDLIDKIRIIKNHGITRSEKNDLDFTTAGLNYRLTDFQAALLLGQLQRFKVEIKKRRNLVGIYQKNLGNLNGLTLPQHNDSHSWQSFMVVLDEGIDRKKVIEYLLKYNIQSNLGAQSLDCLLYFKEKYSLHGRNLLNSTILYQQGLVLPLYGKLTNEKIAHVSKTLIECLSTL
jgi:perosamine synthetase